MTSWPQAALTAVLLVACGDGDIAPPPYDLWLCSSMPESDVQQWKAAVWAWNGAMGRVVLAWHLGDRAGRPGISACTVERLDPSAHAEAMCTDGGVGDGARIEALPGFAALCATHELAHAMGVQWHTRSGLMAEEWATSAIDAEAVRALKGVWGWP